MATHCSILAWEITRTEEPGGLQSMGSQKRVRHDKITTPNVSYPTHSFIYQDVSVLSDLFIVTFSASRRIPETGGRCSRNIYLVVGERVQSERRSEWNDGRPYKFIKNFTRKYCATCYVAQKDRGDRRLSPILYKKPVPQTTQALRKKVTPNKQHIRLPLTGVRGRQQSMPFPLYHFRQPLINSGEITFALGAQRKRFLVTWLSKWWARQKTLSAEQKTEPRSSLREPCLYRIPSLSHTPEFCLENAVALATPCSH